MKELDSILKPYSQTADKESTMNKSDTTTFSLAILNVNNSIEHDMYNKIVSDSIDLIFNKKGDINIYSHFLFISFGLYSKDENMHSKCKTFVNEIMKIYSTELRIVFGTTTANIDRWGVEDKRLFVTPLVVDFQLFLDNLESLNFGETKEIS
jgi:hypothetical protein